MDGGLFLCAFNRTDFCHAAQMTVFAGVVADKAGVEEGLDNFARGFGSDDARAETQDVHFVMFYALMRGVGIVAQPSVDAFHFVGGNARAYAGATHEDAALRLIILQGMTEFLGVVGVVYGFGVVGAEVKNFMPKRLAGLNCKGF